MNKICIALDGPSGAGKSTIAKIISKTLNILYLDTGSMYRTVAFKAIKEGIDTLDAVKLSELIKNIDIKIKYIGDDQHIFLDNEDVSDKIRTPEISIGASNVATIPEVRIKMVELQREIAKENSVIMDGRDIGTYVLPDADMKFFLTASIEERARRRHFELVEKGNDKITFDEVKRDIEFRDKNDSERSFAPLCKADGAIEFNSTDMEVEEVVEKLLKIIRGINENYC